MSKSIDIVRVTCPHCGEKTELTTEDGPQIFNVYDEKRVPVDIAEGFLTGYLPQCEHCKKRFGIKAAFPSHVSIHAYITKSAAEAEPVV